MKTQLNAFSKYFSILAKRLGVVSNWHRVFKTRSSAIGYLNRIPIVLLGKSGRTWVLAVMSFVKFAVRMRKHRGFRGLALYLKVSHTCLIKAVAGTPIKGVFSSLGTCVSVTVSGLPKVIPSIHRKAIKHGDMRVVRFWSTLFSIYRVLPFRGPLNLGTITTVGLKFDLPKFAAFIPVFFTRYISGVGSLERKLVEPKAKIILKSGPGTVALDQDKLKVFRGKFIPMNTTAAIFYTLLALEGKPQLWEAFKTICFKTNGRRFWLQVTEVLRWAKYSCAGSSLIPIFVGKLGLKEEPGKVRVFAMVDWWTQTLLRPLHLALFGILKKIPNDATMNQELGVSRGLEMLRIQKYAASYDLSAATDRLPVSLQSLIVEYIWPGIGEAWKVLLVGREYSVPIAARGWGRHLPQGVTYAVGQPMGALSSWAMLALTHHFIVQYAAMRVGHVRWFKWYLVLGDDIVIFDRIVANSYLEVMRELGVGINLVKSVVSKTSFEFAKRFIHITEGNLSPVSVKEMDVAGASLDARLLLLSHFKPDFSLASLVKFSGGGYRVLAKLDALWKEQGLYWRNLLIYSINPTSPLLESMGRLPDWWSWYRSDSLSMKRDLNLQALKDKMLLYLKSSLPERLKDIAKMITAPELGAGLRPDKGGVLRFNNLFGSLWNPNIKRGPLGYEEKLVLSANKLFYPATLDTDLDKRQINAEWKDIEQFWLYASQEQDTIEILDRSMEFVVELAAKEVDPVISVLRTDSLPRALAPKLLKLFHRLSI